MNAKSLYHTTVTNKDGLVGESYVEGNEGLALGVSSSLVDAPGTNPEQFIGFALSTCFNATLQIVEKRHHIVPDTEISTRVDILKDTVGYKFDVSAKIIFRDTDYGTAQPLVDEALDECPVAKLLKDNENVKFIIVGGPDDSATTFGE
ncbi:OsmC family protein [Furfurilactobacillus sp. WILCCON 0119]|uniref:OsmC family protein n=1 Tax=Furfurilactobacillus entadae TaxID=2922307 RepID=UPI0035F09CBC